MRKENSREMVEEGGGWSEEEEEEKEEEEVMLVEEEEEEEERIGFLGLKVEEEEARRVELACGVFCETRADV